MFNLFEKLNKNFFLIAQPGVAKALLTWPKFSLTSFLMVSRLIKQSIMPGTVIDVGANAGQFTVASSKLFPSVIMHSFEPLPDCFSQLQKNVSSLKNITTYQIALGDWSGQTSLHVNSYSLSSSILPLAKAHKEAFPEATESKNITVEISTLDQIFKNDNLVSPVLLKLDVQGFELQVIKGGINILKHIDYVVMETSFRPMYEGEYIFKDIMKFMEEKNFRFMRPIGWLTSPQNGEILQMDALFVHE